MAYVLLCLFLLGLLVAGNAASRRVARVGAWLTVISAVCLADFAVYYVLDNR